MVAPSAPSLPLEPIAQAIESSAPSLPPLSPPDHALLTRLLALNEDYPALAAQLTTESAAASVAPSSPSVPSCLSASVPSDLLSLLAWSAQPHITAWLTFYHYLQDQHSRRLAITELQTLLKTSDNPIEKRRTATTLLRALDHKWPAARIVNPDRQGGARNPFRRSPEPHASAFPPSPRYKRGEVSGGSATDGEGGCSPSPRSSAPPSLHLTSITHSPPSPPHSPPPTPSITPSPSHTPTDLARAIASDLSTANLLQTASTLAAISTDKLRSDADTIIARLEPHLGLPADAHISPPTYHKPTPPHRHACRITIAAPTHPPPVLTGGGDSRLCENRRGVSSITLGFTKPHNAPWLLNSLDTT